MNKPYITMAHICFEIVSFVLCIVSIIYTAVFAIRTGGVIPTNFNFAGEATGYGSPWVLLLTPGIIFGTNIVMSVVLHFVPTSKWNISFKIRPERELIVFRDISLMIAVMELTMSVWALALTICWSKNAGNALMPLSIILTVALVAEAAIFYIRAYRHNKA